MYSHSQFIDSELLATFSDALFAEIEQPRIPTQANQRGPGEVDFKRYHQMKINAIARLERMMIQMIENRLPAVAPAQPGSGINMKSVGYHILKYAFDFIFRVNTKKVRLVLRF